MCDRCCLTDTHDRRRDCTRHDGHRAPRLRDPAYLTAPTIAVWSAYGRLLFAALPVETAQQWVTQGEAYIEAPHAIRFYDKEYHHGE